MSEGDRVPVRRLLGLALARLGWAPETFWAATPAELYAALEELNGAARRRSFAAFRRQVECGAADRQPGERP